MKLLVFFFLTILLFSCQNNPVKETNATGNIESPAVVKDTNDADTSGLATSQPILPPEKKMPKHWLLSIIPPVTAK